jgi:hypothetical protein
MRRTRETSLVFAVGIVVAAAPVVWYPRAWPAQDHAVSPSAFSWLILVVVSLLPFVLLAVLGGGGAIGRATVALGIVVAAGVVVWGDVAGLDPHSSAQVSAAALVVAPLGACVAVGLLVLADRAVQALSHREQHDSAEYEHDTADAPPRHVLGEDTPRGERREHD